MVFSYYLWLDQRLVLRARQYVCRSLFRQAGSFPVGQTSIQEPHILLPQVAQHQEGKFSLPRALFAGVQNYGIVSGDTGISQNLGKFFICLKVAFAVKEVFAGNVDGVSNVRCRIAVCVGHVHYHI